MRIGIVAAQMMDPREINLHFHTIPRKIKHSIRTEMAEIGR